MSTVEYLEELFLLLAEEGKDFRKFKTAEEAIAAAEKIRSKKSQGAPGGMSVENEPRPYRSKEPSLGEPDGGIMNHPGYPSPAFLDPNGQSLDPEIEAIFDGPQNMTMDRYPEDMTIGQATAPKAQSAEEEEEAEELGYWESVAADSGVVFDDPQNLKSWINYKREQPWQGSSDPAFDRNVALDFGGRPIQEEGQAPKAAATSPKPVQKITERSVEVLDPNGQSLDPEIESIFDGPHNMTMDGYPEDMTIGYTNAPTTRKRSVTNETIGRAFEFLDPNGQSLDPELFYDGPHNMTMDVEPEDMGALASVAPHVKKEGGILLEAVDMSDDGWGDGLIEPEPEPEPELEPERTFRPRRRRRRLMGGRSRLF